MARAAGGRARPRARVEGRRGRRWTRYLSQPRCLQHRKLVDAVFVVHGHLDVTQPRRTMTRELLVSAARIGLAAEGGKLRALCAERTLAAGERRANPQLAELA